MNFISAYCTDEGAMHRINQDSLCIKAAVFNEKTVILAAVCDGMGGLSAGETASAYIIAGLSEWFETDLPELLKQQTGILALRQIFDKKLHNLSDDLSRYSEDTGNALGTTMTAMLFIEQFGKYISAHVGDTRIYHISDQSVNILTNDHSVLSDEIRKGNITEEAAAADSRQNQLTKCIGSGLYNISYDYSISEYKKADIYMLCSDGFRKKISQKEISETLNPKLITDDFSAETSLKKLLLLNIERGESDNITALIIKIR